MHSDILSHHRSPAIPLCSSCRIKDHLLHFLVELFHEIRGDIINPQLGFLEDIFDLGADGNHTQKRERGYINVFASNSLHDAIIAVFSSLAEEAEAAPSPMPHQFSARAFPIESLLLFQNLLLSFLPGASLRRRLAA